MIACRSDPDATSALVVTTKFAATQRTAARHTKEITTFLIIRASRQLPCLDFVQGQPLGNRFAAT
jgi:hypothetical protein